MRHIGSIPDEAAAIRFGDYLLAAGKFYSFSAVPLSSYVLVAAAPLGLGEGSRPEQALALVGALSELSRQRQELLRRRGRARRLLASGRYGCPCVGISPTSPKTQTRPELMR